VARPRLELKARLERFVLGTMMAAVAYVLERRLRKTLARQDGDREAGSQLRENL
jgi:hypothetical protein